MVRKRALIRAWQRSNTLVKPLKQIDEEVRRIINECYARSTKILEDNRDILEAMKNALMEYETIDSEQVADLMARRKVRPPREWNDDDFNSHLRDKDAQVKPLLAQSVVQLIRIN